MKQPFLQFSEWFEVAKQTPAIAEPTAMTLATVAASGQPSARIVLLKTFDERGFVFYTNFESRKGHEITHNPKVALCFYWMPMKRQVRVEGIIVRVSDAEADAYFASRPRGSQIGAWSSEQSAPLANRADFMAAIAANEKKFEGSEVPRPPHWGGFRVVPQVIEFWQEGKFRLHERELYKRDGQGWTMEMLYP